VIARAGMEGFTTDAVAARAEVAEGLNLQILRRQDRIAAAVVAHLLARRSGCDARRGECRKGPVARAPRRQWRYSLPASKTRTLFARCLARRSTARYPGGAGALIRAADLDLTPRGERWPPPGRWMRFMVSSVRAPAQRMPHQRPCCLFSRGLWRFVLGSRARSWPGRSLYLPDRFRHGDAKMSPCANIRNDSVRIRPANGADH